MTLLGRAVTWLGPAWPAPRRYPDPGLRVEGETIPGWIRQEFLACPGSQEPLTADQAEYDVVAAALAQWKQGSHSAVAFLGTFGAGKSTLLRHIRAILPDLPLVHHRFASRMLGETQLLQRLADSLGLPTTGDVDDLAARLQAGPKQVVLLDDCHLLFLRRPGGFVPLDLLLRLISASGRHVLWITTWNVYSWIYLEYVRSVSDFFATVHTISPQSPVEMRRMLLDRLKGTDLQVTWPADEDEAIFRTIWIRARGRPTLAQHIFLRSLRSSGNGQFVLRADTIYRPPHQCQIKSGEEIHALGNLMRHGMLTARELASINHIREAHAAAILTRTTARGLTISLEPDYRLNPIYIDAIVAYLDSRRAISFREVEAA